MTNDRGAGLPAPTAAVPPAETAAAFPLGENCSLNSLGLSPNRALNERDSTDGELNPRGRSRSSWIGMSP